MHKKLPKVLIHMVASNPEAYALQKRLAELLHEKNDVVRIQWEILSRS
jgi:hypothetical protein